MNTSIRMDAQPQQDRMEQPEHQLPPQHLEAERAVLGAILRDNLQMAELTALLKPGDFYKGGHKQIYTAMQQLYERGEPIDYVSILDVLGDETLDSIGGIPYLGDLFDTTPAGTDPTYYAAMIKERARRRRLIHLGTELAKSGYNHERELDAIVAETERDLLALADDETSRPYRRIDDLLTEAIGTIEAFYKSKRPVSGTPTEFYDLDEKINGLNSKDLIIIAGRPAMGKTAFTLNLATNVAKYSHESVLFFSLEMGSEQLVRRVLSSEAHVDQSRLQKGLLDPKAWESLIGAADTLSRLPLFIDDTSYLTVPMMLSKARRLAAELRRDPEAPQLGLVVVDYLQLMHAGGRHERREQEITAISRGLKLLAKELDVSVVAVSLKNRGVEHRTDKRPMMSDLRESGAIEQDADIVLFLYRDEVYNEDTPAKNICEVIIGKQRNGPIGRVELFFNPEWTKFDNLSKAHHVPNADPDDEI